MKNLFVLIVILFASVLSSLSQDHTIGITKSKTPVYIKPNEHEIGTLSSSEGVVIEDQTINYFIIQFKGGNAYIDKSDVKYRKDELKKLKEYRKSNPLTFKPVDLKTEEKQAIQPPIILNSQTIDVLKIEDKYKYEIDHIRYCAGKYRNEIMTGYVFSLAGTALITSTLFVETDNLENIAIMSKIGYGLGILGTILIIDSNKWMKRMYVGPNGIGIQYRF